MSLYCITTFSHAIKYSLRTWVFGCLVFLQGVCRILLNNSYLLRNLDCFQVFTIKRTLWWTLFYINLCPIIRTSDYFFIKLKDQYFKIVIANICQAYLCQVSDSFKCISSLKCIIPCGRSYCYFHCTDEQTEGQGS